MSTNYFGPGRRINTTNGSGSDVASGGVIVSENQVRIALVAIANGASGVCAVDGIWTLDATSADSWVDGQRLYWDAATSKLTSTAGSNVMAGHAVGLKAALTTTAKVRLAAI